MLIVLELEGFPTWLSRIVSADFRYRRLSADFTDGVQQMSVGAGHGRTMKDLASSMSAEEMMSLWSSAAMVRAMRA